METRQDNHAMSRQDNHDKRVFQVFVCFLFFFSRPFWTLICHRLSQNKAKLRVLNFG